VSAGQVFEDTHNAAVVLGADGSRTPLPYGPKDDVADAIWDLVVPLLGP